MLAVGTDLEISSIIYEIAIVASSRGLLAMTELTISLHKELFRA